MKIKIEDIQPIVNFMGWNDMPEKVVLDAAQRIVNNNRCCELDCVGECLTFNEELACISDMIHNGMETQEALWLSLFIVDYETNNDIEMQNNALSLRYEVELDMRHGNLFNEARLEWDI
jgi:hypothetical protein